MKKNLRLILTTLLSIVIIGSCKKDSISKDYTSSIKGKTWWGVITRTGEMAEYYSVHFSEDNSLVLSEMSTDYTGDWSVKGKRLTMNFFGTQVKADISDDGKLTNISDNTNEYILNSGQLIPNPKQSLLNTIWKGEIDLGMTSPFQLSFISTTNVELKVDNTTYGPFIYTRSASGAFIYIFTSTSVFFAVVASDSEMKGNTGLPQYPWQAIKQ